MAKIRIYTTMKVVLWVSRLYRNFGGAEVTESKTKNGKQQSVGFTKAWLEE